VYEGRALRVQLRDINPPKGNWKSGRGRGRFQQHNFNSHRRYNYRPFINGQDNPTIATHGSGLKSPLETNDGQIAVASLSGTPHQRRESMSSLPDVGRETPGADKFREWYDGLESPHTPPPSSQGSSASVTCASYNTPSYPFVHSVPYMSPPWMQPYVPNGSYPMPYYPGYSFYPPQQPPPMMSPPSSDTNGPAVGPLAVWPSGVCGVSFVSYFLGQLFTLLQSFVSYPIGPLRVPSIGQGSANQPPLIPTGFMQNEHGTLVAVYQPEALNQYMSTNIAHQEARSYHAEGAQPSTTPHISHHQGQMAPPSNRPPAQLPYHEGSQPMNAPFDRRPHQNYNNNTGRNNQPGTFPRPYAGRSGRGYLQNTANPPHGSGVQVGRAFGDWNR